jgi:hypothetical protein
MSKKNTTGLGETPGPLFDIIDDPLYFNMIVGLWHPAWGAKGRVKTIFIGTLSWITINPQPFRSETGEQK